jgi:plasmid stabilization system protein ParE
VKVELAAEAEADLEAIAAFIAQDSLPQALWFVLELREACARLADFPRRYPLVRGAVRKTLHGNHLIFFEAKVDTIYVIHILHGATDYETKLDLP